MYILSIDQGTSSTKTIVFQEDGTVMARAVEPLHTFYREGGYVEQDPEDIYRNVLSSVENCLENLKQHGGERKDIKVCGISNQRETFLVWDEAGRPLYNAIVWQCKRSVDICRRLKADGLEPMIREKTGLLVDPYFSGTKLLWLMENVPVVKTAVEEGKAFFGTVDTWLLFKLTNGKSYYTDFTNASRTLFFNLSTLSWDKELLALFGLSALRLPEVRSSSENFGMSGFEELFKEPLVIGSMIGDSHAAAFGEGCFTQGTAKATLGTGCSILMNAGVELKPARQGIVTTVCWSTPRRVDYALEGVIVSCGATIEWLKQEMGLFSDSRESEAMARAVEDNNGVYLVPAFSGLGAPYWQMDRKASITGLGFDCNKNHVVRAALESIAYQIKDVIVAMEAETGIALKELMVNGGITSNRFVLQFLADLLQRPVVHTGMPDASALGAAWLAGLQAKIYRDVEALGELKGTPTVTYPLAPQAQMDSWYAGWKTAINGEPESL